MSLAKKIAFVGAGNMAGALMRGLLRAGACTAGEIFAVDVRPERLEELAQAHGVRTGADLSAACAWADVVVLSVKPQVFDQVLPDVAKAIRAETLVVSIAAGVPISAIEAHMPAGTRVVRTMPNTPALVDAGATAISPGTHASEDDVALTRGLFDSVGVTVVLDETLLDAVTGLSGSGPAYVFLMVEALSDAGVKAGLGRETAQLLAAQTVFGSAKLLLETGEPPRRLRDRVTSPGGTTIAGLQTLEAGGFRAALVRAVEAATRRSQELGEQVAERLREPPR